MDIRYVSWIQLDSNTQIIAQELDYDENTWNKYGTNPIEKLTWSDLNQEQQNSASSLGYDQSSWDCWQNHYLTYKWIDLGQPYIQVLQFWQALGWDFWSWIDREQPPETDSKTWYNLTTEERWSASQLCYFRRTWNEKEVLINGFPIKKPSVRFVDWTNLDDNIRAVADESLKYSSLSWNVLGLNPIESREW